MDIRSLSDCCDHHDINMMSYRWYHWLRLAWYHADISIMSHHDWEEPKSVPRRTKVGPQKDQSWSPEGPKSVPRRTKVGHPERPKSVPWTTKVGPEARTEVGPEARTEVGSLKDRTQDRSPSPNRSKEPKYPFGPSKYWTEFCMCDNLKLQKRCCEVPFLEFIYF